MLKEFDECVFCERVAQVLECASVTPDMYFRTVEGWCSLMAFGLLVMLENDYGVQLPIADFQACAQVKDLASWVTRV